MILLKMIVYLSFSHHHIIVVVFSNVDEANQTTMEPAAFPDGLNSAQDAYGEVASEMPAAYRAIIVPDEDWPTSGLFTVGDGNDTYNTPLRTGFAYRAFVRAFSKQDVNVWHFTNIILLLSLVCYRVTHNSLAHFLLALIQIFLKIQVSYYHVYMLAYHHA